MNFAEVLRVAFTALRANKLRSTLTVLGIVIGIAAVIAVVALGAGAQRSVERRIARLGSTLLQVNARRVRTAGVVTQSLSRLTLEDAEAIRRLAPHVRAVQVQQDRTLPVTLRNRNTRVRIIGTSPNFLSVRNYELARGRMFTDLDESRRRRVAVVGASVLEALGLVLPEQILGRRIRIAGVQFEVIGVLAAKGRTSPFGDPDAQILVPYGTGRVLVFGTDRWNEIWALATADDDVPTAMAEIASVLRRAHRIRAGRPDDFRVRHQAAFLQAMSESTREISLLLGAAAALSLLVGGIGIMNIMLVSVTERTGEIGLRMALGARRRQILAQFLTESVVLCLLGGLLGILAGAGSSLVLRALLGWTMDVTLGSVMVAVIFAATVGVLFGVWPARRAAMLDPIAALRFE